ncbi:hypothetical protein DUT91_23885 [Phyllobacterium salinisoli]|uniref:Uncharacterized protein n=1 Tax=Phyllobacterium salinisoli TaxID=1899321 RepID=A0A368JZ70_9HYPH|nr:hypothetical protein DUT91_23885 [Phyllobacterium salinisoli]
MGAPRSDRPFRFTFRFAKGDRVKEFTFSLPVPLDRGVFKDGSTYETGDGVTWGGHYWIAQDTTTDKPDSGKGWRMAVRRGRDGKDPKAETPVSSKVAAGRTGEKP